ncbi:hypothetical protein QG37_02332 [Candidozyma auris]|nr:hypothetical protein QG37_02332 [[Candida] auris]
MAWLKVEASEYMARVSAKPWRMIKAMITTGREQDN